MDVIDLIKIYLEEKRYVCILMSDGQWVDGKRPRDGWTASQWCRVSKWDTDDTDVCKYIDIYADGTTVWVSRHSISPIKWVLDFCNPDTTFTRIDEILQEAWRRSFADIA